MLDLMRKKQAKRAAPEPELLVLPPSVAPFSVLRKGDRLVVSAGIGASFALAAGTLTALASAVEAEPVTKSVPEGMGAYEDPSLVVEPGARGPELVEMFVSHPGQPGGFAGVLHIRKKESGWSAQLQKDATPYVLSEDATTSGWMPADGSSALPSSLARVVPEPLRYWKFAGSQAQRVRNALVEQAVFKSDLVKNVDGELRLCMSKLFLVESDGVESTEPPVTKATFIDVLGVHDAVNPFAEGVPLEKLEPKDGTLILLSCPDVESLEKAVAYASALPAGAQWLIEYDDSSPAIVKTLSAVGRVFKLDDVEGAEGRAFVSTLAFPPQFVTWLEKAARTEAPKVSKRLDVRLLKADDAAVAEDQRYVLGVVLEPDVVDAQQDTYSADDVRKAAFSYMEDHQNVGLMHKTLVNGKAKIVESYLAPVDFALGTEKVKKGTWLMGVRVQDDALWEAVKKGTLGGFSIGGDAIRTPDEETAATP